MEQQVPHNGLRQNSEDLFYHSLQCDTDSMEHDLLFIASQLVEMSLEIIHEKEDA